jgi:hypothetical protein
MANNPACPNPYSLASGSTTGPDFNTGPENPPNPNGYVPFRPGIALDCPPTTVDLKSYAFQLTQNNDACVQDSMITESINIAGADVYVYKLLGVHEQCKLVDATGHGQAISGGFAPVYPASNAFETYVSEWHSIQIGSGVTSSAFLGYDFGYIKTLDQTRRMYGIDTQINKHITAFAIKQSANQKNRVTQVRLEYSNDNCKWYGAGLATLPDDDKFNTILMKHSAPARYWRLRPTKFNGGTVDPCIPGTTPQTGGTGTTDYWGVQALQLYHNYETINVGNIQDKILLENRDRAYETDPVLMKGYYSIVEASTELSRFGIELPALTYNLQISFTSCVAILGRPLVIGDIVRLPSETQYSSSLTPVYKWMEVTDVTWAANGYTPTWVPLLLKVTAQPAYASEETQDIFGDLAEQPVRGGDGLMNQGNGRNPNFQDFSDIATFIKTTALDNVPENGRETSGYIQEFSDEQKASAATQGMPLGALSKISLNKKGIYGEDAMPPNNAPFTEGPTLPPTQNAKDKAYHRMTYIGPSEGIPARLYRYSAAKNQWVYLETDWREIYNPRKPTLEEFIHSSGIRKEHAVIEKPIPQCDPPNDPEIL